MRQERGLQNTVIVVLAIAILVMSVGFATYSENLKINGTATFNKATWDVRFNKTSFNETSEIKATTKSVEDKVISYSVTLPKPGSTYSFTVNVQNYGTIDAELKKITMTGLTTEQAKYISHKVTYAGTDYTETTDNITGKVIAGGGTATATVVVTVKYELPAVATDLPSENQTVNLNVEFDYVDANL